MKVSIVQFIKGDADIGELASLAKIPQITVDQCGCGFVICPSAEKMKEHRQAAQHGLSFAKQYLSDTSIGMVILDEICAAVNHSLLDIRDLLSAITDAHDNIIIICTGRNAPKALLDIADTVSEITCVKHGFNQGIQAQAGVEF
jgi:cob(I)alamin adenosyltransferase